MANGARQWQPRPQKRFRSRPTPVAFIEMIWKLYYPQKYEWRIDGYFPWLKHTYLNIWRIWSQQKRYSQIPTSSDTTAVMFRHGETLRFAPKTFQTNATPVTRWNQWMKGNGVENMEIFIGSWDVFECISGNMCTLNLVWCRLQFNVHYIHILHTSVFHICWHM